MARSDANANVDSKLHDAASPTDREGETPKRSLRGAAGGIYIGPTRPRAGDTNTAHATAAAAGGVDGSTGYRKRDKYFADGDATGGGTGGSTATVRPTGRSMFRGDGIQGGSIPGYPAQRAAQRAAAVTYQSGGGANMDKRSTIVGEGGRQLGAGGRGTSYKATDIDGTGAADPVGTGVTAGAVKNSRIGTTAATRAVMIQRPTLGTTANPSAGTVALIQGALLFQADLHADDITNGANGLAGAELFLYARDTDTDEDAGLVAKADFDSTTAATVFSGLTASTTYSFYARFRDTAGNVGPMSARSTVATS